MRTYVLRLIKNMNECMNMEASSSERTTKVDLNQNKGCDG